jgi:hypothetical protein
MKDVLQEVSAVHVARQAYNMDIRQASRQTSAIIDETLRLDRQPARHIEPPSGFNSADALIAVVEAANVRQAP